jgi:hypothetical protein
VRSRCRLASGSTTPCWAQAGSRVRRVRPGSAGTPGQVLRGQTQHQLARLGCRGLAPGAAASGLGPSSGHQISGPPQDRLRSNDPMQAASRDSHQVSAANTARSAQDKRGLLTWRRNTATSWRSTRISAFFDVELRASNPNQATSCRKIRYSSPTVTADDHARRPRPAIPHVSSADDLFCTHNLGRTRSPNAGPAPFAARCSAGY